MMTRQRKEWAKHWLCDESLQNMEDKPWNNEELKKLEEAPPRLEECELDKALRLYRVKTGAGFHLKVPLDLTEETGEVDRFVCSFRS